MELKEYDRLVAVDAIPAGDILDAIVAQKVMGWLWPSILDKNVQGYRFNADLPSLGFPPDQREREYKTIGGYAFWTVNGAVPIPKYSTEVPIAWQVAKKVDLPTTLLNLNPRMTCLEALHKLKIDEVVIGTSLYQKSFI